jgi:ubiquinone/menaquinone biosynthesis C-methylase UbiE
MEKYRRLTVIVAVFVGLLLLPILMLPLGFVWSLALLSSPANSVAQTVRAEAATNRYELRSADDPNGIAKYYMGRQIAHVMGHQAADWLERPTRQLEEKTDEMIEALKLKPGDVVADIGAGTGYVTWRMAKKVGATGKVYAVEIQQEMLDLLDANMKERGVTNVVKALGTVSDPKLPTNAVDLIIMVDVYHEFDHPYEMTEGMARALKAGGRLVFVEFRKEDPNVPIKEVHKMSIEQVKKEMAVHPLEYVETISTLPWQHIIIFKKKGDKPRASFEPLKFEPIRVAPLGSIAEAPAESRRVETAVDYDRCVLPPSFLSGEELPPIQATLTP